MSTRLDDLISILKDRGYTVCGGGTDRDGFTDLRRDLAAGTVFVDTKQFRAFDLTRVTIWVQRKDGSTASDCTIDSQPGGEGFTAAERAFTDRQVGLAEQLAS